MVNPWNPNLDILILQDLRILKVNFWVWLVNDSSSRDQEADRVGSCRFCECPFQENACFLSSEWSNLTLCGLVDMACKRISSLLIFPFKPSWIISYQNSYHVLISIGDFLSMLDYQRVSERRSRLLLPCVLCVDKTAASVPPWHTAPRANKHRGNRCFHSLGSSWHLLDF